MDYNTPPTFQPMPGAQLPTAPAAAAAGRGKGRGKGKDKGKDGDKPTTKRVIDRQKKIAALFAVLVAAGAGGSFLLAEKPDNYVVRTINAVPAMTQLTTSMVEPVAVTDEIVEPGAIVGKTAQEAMDAAAKAMGSGARTQFPLTSREQLHADDLSTDGTMLQQPLGKDERLVSVRATIASAVAGAIRPGDHVDLVAVASGGAGMSGVVASDIPVVSVTVSEDQYNNAAQQQAGEGREQKAGELLPAQPIPGIYVLRVKADLLTKVTVVDANAKLYVVYRGEGATKTDNVPATVTQAICEGAVGVAGC